MKFLSVCSGIEAASAAWEPLGWSACAFAEIEAFPSAVLAHHFPTTPNLGDMTRHHEWPATLRPDLLVGGTPCQGFSIAGLRKGLADPRSQLSLTFVDLAAKYRPAWLVWENVPGVLSSASGSDFAEFLGALTGRRIHTPAGGWQNAGHIDGIPDAYGIAWRVLDAQFAGVPQRRRRVFLVGYLGDWRPAAAVLFERESLLGNPPPSRAPREGTAGSITTRARNGSRQAGANGNIIPQVCPTLRAGGNRTGGDRPPGTDVDTADSLIPTLAGALQERDAKGSDSSTKPGHLIPVAFTQNSRSEVRSIGGDGAIAGALAAETGAQQQTYVTFQPRIARNGRGYSEGAVPALNGADAGATSDMRPCVASPMAVRRLTPTECERLQGFPDGWTAIPWRGKPAQACPDGPRYKALGNSMAVPVMRWLGKRIALIDSLASDLSLPHT